ncbi:hypothetical protein ACJX0J_033364, partial [Zea mays]
MNGNLCLIVDIVKLTLFISEKFRWLGFWKIAHIWFKISILSDNKGLKKIMFWHIKLNPFIHCITSRPDLNIWSGTLVTATPSQPMTNLFSLILYLLHDNCKLILIDLLVESILFSSLLFVNAAWTMIGDVHCVDWNPLDFLI